MQRRSILLVMIVMAAILPSVANAAEEDAVFDERILPTYLDDVVKVSDWKSNWFFGIQGGASSFLGTPSGCSDVIDRIKPALQVNAGKWMTPSLGSRICYQGMEFWDSGLVERRYGFFHADLLYDIRSDISSSENGSKSWTLIPFVGMGVISNYDRDFCCKCTELYGSAYPFAFSYGLLGRIGISRRISVTAEISGMTTFRSFDGVGRSDRLGDNMLSLFTGLSINIGKTGWRRIIDARPYMIQNDRLMERSQGDIRTVITEKAVMSSNPRNNYSGLNSLRARMSADKGEVAGIVEDIIPDTTLLCSILETDVKKVAPESGELSFYFYFGIGSEHIADDVQMMNIRQLATLARNGGLKVTVTGSADSATGTREINDHISKGRADHVVQLLLENGVDENVITACAIGGTDRFNPVEANRNVCVTLSFS